MHGASYALRERLLARREIDPETGCWHWLGGRTSAGYGQIGVDGKVKYAHRMSYLAFRGVDPGTMLVCHHCDNPRCFNPDHLFLGDKRANAVDAVKKGILNPPRKVSPEDAREIQRRALAGERHAVLADEFGVCTAHISWLRHRPGPGIDCDWDGRAMNGKPR